MTSVFGSLKATTIMGNKDKGKFLVEQVKKLTAIAYNKKFLKEDGEVNASAFSSYYGISLGTCGYWFEPRKISFAYIKKIHDDLGIAADQLIKSGYDAFLEITGIEPP